MDYAKELQNKWAAVLDADVAGKIKDADRRSTTAVILENTEKALRDGASFTGTGLLAEAAPTNATGSAIQNYDPVMISLVRRTVPNLIAYDIAGVQPMTGPTGLIFAMRARYGTQSGTEAFYNEANTAYSSVVAGNTTLGQAANNVGTLPTGNSSTYNFAGGMSTAQAEGLGTASNVAFAEMAFSIEKVAVTAKSRALKAEYSMELAQDLKAIHGLDAESELANILTTEIMAEINREVVRTVYLTAKSGAQENTATAGEFDLDVDSNGRWLGEKFKGLVFQIEREQNKIARETRRGKGNILICSSDVASALQMAGALDYTPALQAQLNVDDTGYTFAGILGGRTKVYIDPYFESSNGTHYMVVGYKGPSQMDAGLFYCPYVPLQMVRAVGENSFIPKIGFKTRYGMVANPYAEGLTAGAGALNMNSNVYYRRVHVKNIM
jgi:hypothetical protein